MRGVTKTSRLLAAVRVYRNSNALGLSCAVAREKDRSDAPSVALAESVLQMYLYNDDCSSHCTLTAIFHYPDGSPMRDGDVLALERGIKQGLVVKIVDEQGIARTLSVHGPGIVVDAEPGGLVFLSTQCLTEDPPALIQRGPGGWTRFLARVAMGLGVVALLPGLVSLLSGMYSAANTGEVLVVMLGYSDGRIESVPWLQGWARFAGPLLLFTAVATGAMAPRWSSRWYLACAASGLGVLMLLESFWFTSVGGSLFAVAVFFGLPLAATRFRKDGAPL